MSHSERKPLVAAVSLLFLLLLTFYATGTEGFTCTSQTIATATVIDQLDEEPLSINDCTFTAPVTVKNTQLTSSTIKDSSFTSSLALGPNVNVTGPSSVLVIEGVTLDSLRYSGLRVENGAAIKHVHLDINTDGVSVSNSLFNGTTISFTRCRFVSTSSNMNVNALRLQDTLFTHSATLLLKDSEMETTDSTHNVHAIYMRANALSSRWIGQFYYHFDFFTEHSTFVISNTTVTTNSPNAFAIQTTLVETIGRVYYRYGYFSNRSKLIVSESRFRGPVQLLLKHRSTAELDVASYEGISLTIRGDDEQEIVIPLPRVVNPVLMRFYSCRVVPTCHSTSVNFSHHLLFSGVALEDGMHMRITGGNAVLHRSTVTIQTVDLVADSVIQLRNLSVMSLSFGSAQSRLVNSTVTVNDVVAMSSIAFNGGRLRCDDLLVRTLVGAVHKSEGGSQGGEWKPYCSPPEPTAEPHASQVALLFSGTVFHTNALLHISMTKILACLRIQFLGISKDNGVIHNGGRFVLSDSTVVSPDSCAHPKPILLLSSSTILGGCLFHRGGNTTDGSSTLIIFQNSTIGPGSSTLYLISSNTSCVTSLAIDSSMLERSSGLAIIGKQENFTHVYVPPKFTSRGLSIQGVAVHWQPRELVSAMSAPPTELTTSTLTITVEHGLQLRQPLALAFDNELLHLRSSTGFGEGSAVLSSLQVEPSLVVAQSTIVVEDFRIQSDLVIGGEGSVFSNDSRVLVQNTTAARMTLPPSMTVFNATTDLPQLPRNDEQEKSVSFFDMLVQNLSASILEDFPSMEAPPALNTSRLEDCKDDKTPRTVTRTTSLHSKTASLSSVRTTTRTERSQSTSSSFSRTGKGGGDPPFATAATSPLHETRSTSRTLSSESRHTASTTLTAPHLEDSVVPPTNGPTVSPNTPFVAPTPKPRRVEITTSVMLPQSEAAATVVLSTAGASSAVASTLGSGGAGVVVVAGSSLRLMQCGISEDDPRPAQFELPLQFFPIGTGTTRYFAGAAASHATLQCVLLAAAILYFRTFTSKTSKTSRELITFLSLLFCGAHAFFTPAVLGACSTVLNNDDDRASLFAAGTSAVVIVLIHCATVVAVHMAPRNGVVATRRVQSVRGMKTKLEFVIRDADTNTTTASNSSSEESDDTEDSASGVLQVPIAGSGYSDDSSCSIDQQPSTAFWGKTTHAIFLTLFDGCRHFEKPLHRHYASVETTLFSIIAVVSGARPERNCSVAAFAVGAIAIAQLLYIILIRPYRTALDMVFSILNAAVLATLSVCVIVTVQSTQRVDSNDEAESPSIWTRTVMEGCLWLVSVLGFVQLGVQGFWAYYVSQRRQQACGDGNSDSASSSSSSDGDDDSGENVGNEDSLRAIDRGLLSRLLLIDDRESDVDAVIGRNMTPTSSRENSTSSTSNPLGAHQDDATDVMP